MPLHGFGFDTVELPRLTEEQRQQRARQLERRAQLSEESFWLEQLRQQATAQQQAVAQQNLAAQQNMARNAEWLRFEAWGARNAVVAEDGRLFVEAPPHEPKPDGGVLFELRCCLDEVVEAWRDFASLFDRGYVDQYGIERFD